MVRSATDWYLVIIVALLTAACGAAVFYLKAFTTVDTQWFENIGLTGFGALLGLLTQKSTVVAVPPPPVAEDV